MGSLRGGGKAAAAGTVEFDVAGVDAWLRGGGRAVAASERAARALTTAFHRARRAEGLSAWPAPQIQDWNEFARGAWNEAAQDDRLVLNPLQEQSLWADIVRASGEGSALLEGPRQRMAALAMEAHRLLCQYAPQFLSEKARGAWQQDAGTFSGWLKQFEDACRSGRLISAAQLPLELLPIFERGSSDRPPLLLAGFDRIMPVQRRVFSAWGETVEARPGQLARHVHFYQAVDEQAELAACALWCKNRLAADPHARLLVVTQEVAERRGEIERAFLRFAGGARFEFSLGVSLGSIGLGRGARLVLRWLLEALEEQEIDWLFSTGQAAADAAESSALTGAMRALRRRGLERPRWKLEDFIAQSRGELPAPWVARFMDARRQLEEFARRPQLPLAWAEQVAQLLEIVGWPGARPLTSAEFQALRRWRQTLDACASLGFAGRRMSWSEFFPALERALDQTLFAPESHDAPIQIAGPAESAGLSADAIWFVGANEDAWPAAGSMHPLLPFQVQRDAQMPHARPQLDWELARAVTGRLLGSAPEMHFSYAGQSEGVEMRPSRLVTQFAGDPLPLPKELVAPPAAEPVAVWVDDFSRLPYPAAEVAGGSTVLTSQSQCPFKAFAMARLAAQGWEPAQAGLTPAQRGKLLHAVLHSVWGEVAPGIRTYKQLMCIANLSEFVQSHVRSALPGAMPDGARERMSRRYIELEEIRLVSLVTEWLEFERTRAEFAVARTEFDVDRSIAGVSLSLRLDRIDRLKDGSLLVIDYKSGDVSPKLWELPRPDDVQLPLYAGFGLDEELRAEIALEFDGGAGREAAEETAGRIGGLVFAKVRPGEVCFEGRVGDAQNTLLPGVSNRKALAQNKLAAEELIAWREYIGQMARDFVEGRAGVDPRDYPKTCERCDLQALCRVHEIRADAGDADEEAEDE